MSNETMADLNSQTLIGMVEERGPAWHRRDDLQGDEDNHYPRFIPTADVTRRIFNWAPVTAGVAYLVPAEHPVPVGTPSTGLYPGMVTINGQLFRVVPSQQGRVGTLRGDNDYDMGVFKSDVKHRPYAELIRDAEKLTGQTLGISSAGVLAKGSRAWVELSMPETIHDATSGVSFRPNLVKADSMDGSLANTTFRSSNITICDNTLTWNLLEARSAGQLFKRKHTSLSLGDIQEERDALAIIVQMKDEMTQALHAMIAKELNREQRIEVMDILVPLPTDDGRARTLADNKRSQLMALDSDPMVSPWVGNAFGEVQRYNTFDHHFSNIKNTGRSERNTWMAINGKRAAQDRLVVSAIEKVLA